jgi:ABC-type glycerol-3-phosphate transport system substrate-binding protein
MNRHFALIVAVSISVAGCGGGGGSTAPVSESRFKPINEQAAVYWDRQTTETAELIRAIGDDFNAQHPGKLPVKIEHTGGYTEIFQKVVASIQAGSLPSMAVAYQSMTAEYIQAGAVASFEQFINDPSNGLSPSDLEDFFPVVLETNRYPDAGNKMYSFPFCKSALMMYFNKRVLSSAGIEAPPRTWNEFVKQCRQIKDKTGKFAYAVSADCSMVTGMIFSLGGDVVSGRTTLFDSPASIQAFEIIETLAREKLAYQIPPNTYDDESAFAHDDIAFAFRSSSGRTSIKAVMGDAQDAWGMAIIPQGDPEHPTTVLFGPNICIFNTTSEQQKVAWDFVKYFTSPEVSVRWALGSGYLPFRKSAANDPNMKKFWDEWPYNRAAYDCLPYSKTEPNLVGWQEVRSLVEKAETQILSGVKTAREAVAELKANADAALARQ